MRATIALQTGSGPVLHAPLERADRLYRALREARDECRRSGTAMDRARGVMSFATATLGDRAADRSSEGEGVHD